jgi:diaminopimelate decarboxylase
VRAGHLRVAALEPSAASLALAVRLGQPDVGLGLLEVGAHRVLTFGHPAWEHDYAVPATVEQASALCALRSGAVALAPPAAVMASPAVQAASALDLELPPALAVDAPDTALMEFGRRHGWQLRVREASLGGSLLEVADWPTVRQACANGLLPDERWLEARPAGQREELHFCAAAGALIDAVFVAEVVPAGRDVAPTATPGLPIQSPAGPALDRRPGTDREIAGGPPELRAALQALLAAWTWTGGGCLITRRGPDGTRWFERLTPCFGPGVDALALAGRNLPGSLLGELATVSARRRPGPRPADPRPPLARRCPSPHRQGSRASGADQRPSLDPRVLEDVEEALAGAPSTPERLYLPRTADRAVERAAQLEGLGGAAQLRLAYSVKTNPDPRLLRLVAQAGLMVEVISQRELARAVEQGSSAQHAVLNSAGKWWPRAADDGPAFACFDESCEELEQTLAVARECAVAQILGPRVRGAGSHSRLGLVFDRPADLDRLGVILGQLPAGVGLGVHFHTAAGLVGYPEWWELANDVVAAAVAVGDRAGRPVELVDLGGGWSFEDFEPEMRERFPAWLASARARLPRLRCVLLEPGKAIAEPVMALAVSVLLIRHTAKGREAVVDGSVAELPGAALYPHRLLARDSAGGLHLVGRGPDRVVGRLPSDGDVLCEFRALPTSLKAGDHLVFLDAGAYDTSLAYSFGRGDATIARMGG